MSRDDDITYAEASRWHAMSADDSMDWDGFTLWLEADPRHQQAYDAVALGDALIAEHGDSLRAAFPAAEPVGVPANDDMPAPTPAFRNWKRWAGTAIAASLVAMLALPQLTSAPVRTYATEGGSRVIALDDGSSVTLAPHSRLKVEGRDQERLALDGGAWFDIRHDPSRQMEIQAGDVRIADIGTRFDVQETADQVRVEVAQGKVRVGSDALARPINLVEGHGLLYDAKAGSALVRPIGQDAAGEWRSGRLTYDSTPLPLVAADLSRYAGVQVTVAQDLRSRQFSGTLVIGDGDAALRDLAQLLDVELRRSPAGYVLDQHR